VATSSAGACVALAVLAACSDDPARDTFDPPDTGADAVNLPDGATVDTGPAVDARPPFDPAEEAVTCTATPCATQLVAGSDHFCVRLQNGTVQCWGSDAYGALGAAAPTGDAGTKDSGAKDAGDAGDAAPPPATRIVSGLTTVAQLSAAGSTTCARLEDGTVKCWGANVNGELGLAVNPPVFDEDPHPTPKNVALPNTATRIDVGHGSACALLSTGSVACWGKDDQVQLARATDGGVEMVRGPGIAAMDSLAVLRTAFGSYTGLALTTTAEVWSWGALSGDEGTVSGRIASISPDRTPRRIPELAKVTSLVASHTRIYQPEEPEPIPGIPPPPVFPVYIAHACALANGEVYCWGRSDRGALCTGIPDRELTPAHAPLAAKAWPQQLAVADEITCARMTDGTVQCCGDDAKGRLGTGTSSELFSAFFRPAEGFTGRAVQVATSDHAVCVLVQGGTVECWGGNKNGELGTGTRDDAAHPKATKVDLQ